MAKESMKDREVKRAKLVAKYAAKRAQLKAEGNYTLGIQEQIIFPEINIDSITRILGMNITFVTSA